MQSKILFTYGGLNAIDIRLKQRYNINSMMEYL